MTLVVAGSSPVTRPLQNAIATTSYGVCSLWPKSLDLYFSPSAVITIVLHTHLPWVLHHGAWPHGSDWVCEAVAECYIPLLTMCQRLLDDGIKPGLTFTISPVLAEQISQPDFPELFSEYCRNHAELARNDRTILAEQGAPEQQLALCDFWVQWYEDALLKFEKDCGGSIVATFADLQSLGAIEMITCGATHGYLPLLAEDASVHLQVALAQRVHQRHFGERATGIWMPECAYRPRYPWRTLLPVPNYTIARDRQGVEEVLVAEGLKYTVIDEGTLSGAMPLGMRRPDGIRLSLNEADSVTKHVGEERSPFDVVLAGSAHSNAAVSAFTRSMQIALQVWSGQTGYPGDPDYLDFHKKYYKSSLRYWRVTDVKADMAHKDFYNPSWAAAKAEEHALHFVSILEVSVKHRSASTGRIPTICLPFDTELFGHWWFEGPLFLEHVLRGMHRSTVVRPTTLGERDAETSATAVVALPESSWGRNGNHDVWMHATTKWMWEKEYKLEYRVRMLFEKHAQRVWTSDERNVLDAMMRQVLLAQASDWPFLVSTASATDYATMRFHGHVEDANGLADLVERLTAGGEMREADKKRLDGVNSRDTLFPELLDVMGLRGPTNGGDQ